jgi:hypothetical protein
MQEHLRAKLKINRPTSCMRRAMVWLTLIAYVGQPLIVTAQVSLMPMQQRTNAP